MSDGRGGIFSSYLEKEKKPGPVDLFGFTDLSFASEKKEDKKEEFRDQANNGIGSEKSDKFLDDEHKQLYEDSLKSKYRKQINDELLNNIKIQKEKIKLLKASGEVAYIKDLEFIYIHYLEKANTDFVKMFRKLRNRIDGYVNDKRTDDLISFLEKEAAITIKNVKAAQAKEISDGSGFN